MSQFVTRPLIPYQGAISGGIHEGKRIKITGQVPYGADRFTVNLMTGLDSSSDRPLHISVRFNISAIVRNTLMQNAYGSEERGGPFPFSVGSNFTLIIQVERTSYKVFVNGTHCFDYSHRLPFTRVISMLIDGDVQIDRIEYTNKVLPSPKYATSSPVTLSSSSSSVLPCTFPIYGGIRPGMSIYITGRPTGNPKKVTINIQSGAATSPPPDVAFHFDARFESNAVVRNSRVNGVWSAEERMISYFPFQPACNFDMIIKVQSDAYVVTLNGQHFLSFRHRLNAFPRFNVLYVENDVIVTSIRYN